MREYSTRDVSENKGHSPNISFYKNEIRAKPNAECIDEILLKWPGNYCLLEQNCSYIQWLFPNRNPGVNAHASVLTDKEAQMISSTPELRDKVKKAFEMMLDFYGMSLKKNKQFELAENSEARLKELNKSWNHNYQRITRILLGLKELGHADLMLPWMKFIAELIYKEEKLNLAQSSFENFWINTLDSKDKEELIEYNNMLLGHKPGISQNFKEESVPNRLAPTNSLDEFGIPISEGIFDTTGVTEIVTTPNNTSNSLHTVSGTSPNVSTTAEPALISNIPNDIDAHTTADDTNNSLDTTPIEEPPPSFKTEDSAQDRELPDENTSNLNTFFDQFSENVYHSWNFYL